MGEVECIRYREAHIRMEGGELTWVRTGLARASKELDISELAHVSRELSMTELVPTSRELASELALLKLMTSKLAPVQAHYERARGEVKVSSGRA